MNYIILLLIIPIIAGVIGAILFRDDVSKHMIGFVFIFLVEVILIGTLTCLLVSNQVNYSRVYSSLEVSCKSDFNNSELEDEIRSVLDKESKGRYEDLKINIEEYDITGGKTQMVKISFKEKILFNYLYLNGEREFNITVSNKEENVVKVYE